MYCVEEKNVRVTLYTYIKCTTGIRCTQTRGRITITHYYYDDETIKLNSSSVVTTRVVTPK